MIVSSRSGLSSSRPIESSFGSGGAFSIMNNAKAMTVGARSGIYQIYHQKRDLRPGFSHNLVSLTRSSSSQTGRRTTWATSLVTTKFVVYLCCVPVRSICRGATGLPPRLPPAPRLDPDGAPLYFFRPFHSEVINTMITISKTRARTTSPTLPRSECGAAPRKDGPWPPGAGETDEAPGLTRCWSAASRSTPTVRYISCIGSTPNREGRQNTEISCRFTQCRCLTEPPTLPIYCRSCPCVTPFTARSVEPRSTSRSLTTAVCARWVAPTRVAAPTTLG